jgi:hypothetical protein
MSRRRESEDEYASYEDEGESHSNFRKETKSVAVAVDDVGFQRLLTLGACETSDTLFFRFMLLSRFQMERTSASASATDGVKVNGKAKMRRWDSDFRSLSMDLAAKQRREFDKIVNADSDKMDSLKYFYWKYVELKLEEKLGMKKTWKNNVNAMKKYRISGKLIAFRKADVEESTDVSMCSLYHLSLRPFEKIRNKEPILLKRVSYDTWSRISNEIWAKRRTPEELTDEKLDATLASSISFMMPPPSPRQSLVVKDVKDVNDVKDKGDDEDGKMEKYLGDLVQSEKDKSMHGVHKMHWGRTPYDRSNTGPPPRTYICHNCQKPGHWRQACPNKHGETETGPVRKIKIANGIHHRQLRLATQEEIDGSATLFRLPNSTDQRLRVRVLGTEEMARKPIQLGKALFD